MRRFFACVRTAVVAPLFIWLWMVFMPRWLGGAHAFNARRPFGWIIVALGAAIALPSISLFAWRGLGTPALFDPPRRLVISGPYRFVRNPMYTGFAIALIGEALAYPHLTRVLLIELLTFVALATLSVTTHEEPALRRKFGEPYANYCRNVHRWIPRFRPFDNI